MFGLKSKSEPKIKLSEAECHREYARVVEMCEGTGVNPSRCIKYDIDHEYYCNENRYDLFKIFRNHSNIKFATSISRKEEVIIIEEPVFDNNCDEV